MLLRHLHRPLLRSVTAAWRPATSLAPFHPGETRADSSSAQQQQQGEDHDQHAASAPGPPRTKPSLFDQLFPDEAKQKARSASDADAPRHAWISGLSDDEPPRLAVPEAFQHEDVGAQEAPELSSAALRAKGMLILSAASKTLLESDFLRLGAKGKHVEGWIAGILKVIQARHPDTLEPQGHYFILFDTHEAAMAYKDRVEELWKLGKAHVPGAHHARWHQIQQPLPRGLRRTENGEDVAELIRSFTLVPPSQHLHLQLSRASPARIAALYLEGAFVDRLAARAGSDFLVLVRLDGGRMALNTLRRAIEDDGVRRNLAWRITDLDNGILPFGKSILKAKDRAHVDATDISFLDDEGSVWGLAGAADGHHSVASGNGPGNGVDVAVYGPEGSDKKYRQYPRFIIPFMDKAEAHRFVQNWHRRELRLRMGDGGGTDESSWEETRIINATVLW
ncbi:hypothetical protein F4802DRAFT_154600 [Xylaria palmicola]|nr:hypothetical protein F4802DRAFT_154600 [Xylaria palmicola]